MCRKAVNHPLCDLCAYWKSIRCAKLNAALILSEFYVATYTAIEPLDEMLSPNRVKCDRFNLMSMLYCPLDFKHRYIEYCFTVCLILDAVYDS